LSTHNAQVEDEKEAQSGAQIGEFGELAKLPIQCYRWGCKKVNT
jgi:hypothetical protein